MIYDVIVIGGGQAGLSTGYFLKKHEIKFLILDEQSQSGESWRKRYNSLILFTPRFYSSLPGLKLPGAQQEYPTKDEMADYMSTYKEKFDLPVLYQKRVQSLQKNRNIFSVQTNDGIIHQSLQVVVATGAFHTPYTPLSNQQLDDHVLQLHAADYRDPKQIPDGEVLIVGSGNTGVQIAAELSKSHKVTLSCGKKMMVLPQKIFRKNLFWWFDVLGISSITAQSNLGKWVQKRDPLIGCDIKKIKSSVIMKERLIEIKGSQAMFEKGSTMNVQSVIWATGYRNNYDWIKIPGALDQRKPVHDRGISSVKGLYYVGLSWQQKRGSALIKGVDEDAKYIVKKIMDNQSYRKNR